jgi:flagellar protein FliO/FliZ
MRLTLALLLTGPTLALAGTDPGRVESLTVVGGGMLTQLTLGLAVVLALAVGLSWLLRRHVLPRGGVIRVIGGLPLGSRERLLLIEVDETRLLIGVTAQQIQTLHVFPPAPPFAITPDPRPPESSNDCPES